MYSLQPEPERAHRWIVLIVAGLLSTGVQAGALFAASRIEPRARPAPKTQVEMVMVKRPAPTPIEVPPPPPPVEALKPVEAPKPKPKPKPKAKAPKPKPKKAKRPKRRPKKVARKAPPKPVAPKAESPQPPPKTAAPRLIAGLSLGSTVTGGSGPRMGIGNTALGDPGRVASAPVKRARPSGQPDGEGRAPKTEHRPVRVAARLKRKTQPAYPKGARRQGIEGVVIVLLTINDAGRVAGARVVKGIGHGLDEAALAAARKTIWTPATMDGAPIKSTRRFNVRFTLES